MAKLELHTVLRHLDQRNFSIWAELKGNQAAQTEVTRQLGWLLPLWMSDGANNGDHAVMVFRFNHVANRDWYVVADHPNLQLQLLAHVGTGNVIRHAYHHVANVKKGSKLLEFLRLGYPDIRQEEVALWAKFNGEANLRVLMDRHGIQENEAKEIVADYHKVVMQ